MAAKRKLTTPQIRALRSTLPDHFRGVTGHHDGMTIKSLKARGFLDDNRCLTDAGRLALVEVDEVSRNAFILRGEFDNAGFWHEGREKACRRFCDGQHETWTRDDLGNAVRTLHHHTPLACCLALAEAGKTWKQICWAFS